MSLPRVLVADDDAAMRAFLTEAFAEDGYETFEAASGSDVLKHLRGHPADVVVIDPRMQKTSGLEALIRLRTEAPDLPVVLLSAFADETMVREANALGVTHVFPKPFSLAELLAVVRKLTHRNMP